MYLADAHNGWLWLMHLPSPPGSLSSMRIKALNLLYRHKKELLWLLRETVLTKLSPRVAHPPAVAGYRGSSSVLSDLFEVFTSELEYRTTVFAGRLV